jgi:tetratricopeptide (TPR) repeat protein
MMRCEGLATVTDRQTLTTRDAGRDGADPAPSADADAPVHEEAQRLGRYLLIGSLGAGGMGIVYSAYDPQLDRKVAIKLLLPGRGGPREQARLLHEAQAMAKLDHPNVVAVHDVGEHDGRVYLAMEFVDGQTLGQWLRKARPSWTEALAMLVQAGRGLQAAHDAGLVHRDFKPDNVLISDGTDGRRARVTDFGLARPSASVVVEPDLRRSEPQDEPAAKTRKQALAGTPAYMAPELFEGAIVDARSDQFAWCVAVWETLFRVHPFPGESVVEVTGAVGKREIVEPRRGTKVPRWVRRVLRRGLAIDPAARWPSMAALLAALARGQARGRVRTAAVAIGVVALAGVAVHAWRRSEEARSLARCDDAGVEIADVWPGRDDAARTRVRDGLLATATSSAETTAHNVQPWLDEYARAWERAGVQACTQYEMERAWGDDMHARALECLDERRGELAALVDELARADRGVVHDAVGAAAGLPRLEPCTDPVVLARRTAMPAELREAVMGVRLELARASALQRAGRHDEAVRVAEAALEQARGVEWPPLSAEARTTYGIALDFTGQYERAEQQLVDAYIDAATAGATDVAERAATRLVWVMGVHRARHDAAMFWGRLAQVELGRMDVGADDFVAAPRITNLAHAQYRVGAYAEAKALYEQSLAIRERALGSDHPEIATELENLANVSTATGAYAQARALHRRALEIRESTVGRDHPDIAVGLTNLANVDYATGAYADARAANQRALEILERAYGPDHPDVATAVASLAVVQQAQGEVAAAQASYEQALAVFERTLGPDHPSVATVLGNLANLAVERGEHREAKAMYERALAIFEGSLGPRHPHVAAILGNLANALAALGDERGAKAMYGRSLAILEETLGADHPDVAHPLAGIGRLALAQKRPADAIAPLERAVRILEAGGVPGREVALARAALADALWAAKRDRGRAIELGERVVEELRAVGPGARDELVAAEAWVADRR